MFLFDEIKTPSYNRSLSLAQSIDFYEVFRTKTYLNNKVLLPQLINT